MALFSYIASTFLGFESLCAAEITSKLSPSSVHILPGRVLFSTSLPAQSVGLLRSVSRVSTLCIQVKLTEREPAEVLRKLEHIGKGLDWKELVENLYGIKPELREVYQGANAKQNSLHQFRATCERQGKNHLFNSVEAAAALGSGVGDSTGWKVNLKSFNTEVVLEIHEDDATVGLVLYSDLHRRNRTANSGNWKTALNASFAYCFVKSLDIKPGQIICDPMCGIGTLPIEAALDWKDASYIGGDIDAASIEVAKNNASFCRLGNVEFFVWDSTRLPLASQCIDIIVTDLPFGHRHGNFRLNQQLYPQAFAEYHRVLKKGGMVLFFCALNEI